VTLAAVLGAAGARYLRCGDDFLALPRGPLVDEARRAAATSAGGPRLGTISVLRALAREPAAAREAAAAARSSPLARALAAIAAGSALPSAPEPRGYVGTLRPHQRAGLDWLWSLRLAGLGGVLADEMGLGKTHVALALIVAALEDGERRAGAPGADLGRPSLVLAPTSVVDPWLEKAAAFAPGLAPIRYAGRGRGRLLEGLGPRSLVVASYGVLVRDQDALAAIDFDVVVFDEAHRLKNAETDVARAAARLRARTRIALTGTPIENQPAELRALYELVAPGWLPPEAEFAELERDVLAGDLDAVETMRRLVHPFKLRRLKRDVLPELPPKLEETRTCELSDDQAALYREVLDEARASLRAGAGLAALLAAITRLKRVCDHPALVLPDGRGAGLRSAKLELLAEVLASALGAGKKVVVFTQYLEMMDLIEERLGAEGVPFAELRGSTRDRARAIRRFQDDPACRVMVVSLLAGGVGIDLTSATVVVHYDRWWTAAREDQATDRVHRIGQERGVEVVRLVTRGTLEERIDAIIAEKSRLLDDVLGADDPGAARRLGREEIAALLEA
jgi:SNF2 family DNA or RNA helicase